MTKKQQDKWPDWYKLSDKQREAVVRAELDRPMTPRELAAFEAGIRYEAGLDQEEDTDDDAESFSKPHLRLVWDRGD